MDLFSYQEETQIDRMAPLASRMRPVDFDQFVGQEHIIGKGTLLRRAIEADHLSSIILYGPPGTGKTTLAEMISRNTKSTFVKLHAVTSGVKEIRDMVGQANEKRRLYRQRTVAFIDEIHHFNKTQQDALLPHVEDGTIILIGATTENPYFEVNAALLSRSMVFALKELTDEDLQKVLRQAIADTERGYGKLSITIDEPAEKHLLRNADGDARRLLNSLELAVATTPPDAQGIIHITLEVAEESIQRRAVKYDKQGDQHYDTVSAFIKSIRGSDPDAAVYWLARMLDAGENPRFIARRIIISASEDVGNADPQALSVALAAFQAYEVLGMPEGRIPLAQAVTYLATAPKSNASYNALNQAMQDVKTFGYDQVPVHLRDSAYKGAAALGHGAGYLYPHNFPDNYVPQDYLPQNAQGKKYYFPTSNGYEKTISVHMDFLSQKGRNDI